MRVLILDEPTTALSGSEVDQLFDFLRQLKAEGVAIVYVSHRMDEIFKIADRATILRDGRHVVTAPLSEFTLESMIEHIVGRRSRGFSDVERETARSASRWSSCAASGARQAGNVDLSFTAARSSASPACSAAAAARWPGCCAGSTHWPAARSGSTASRWRSQARATRSRPASR